MGEGGGRAVELVKVKSDESDLRLDRWFRRRYPTLTHGRLARLLRTGQVRLDGRRADAGDRVQAGQEVRVPPLDLPSGKPAPASERRVEPREAAALKERVLYRDDDIIVIDKPAGLAVQGGTGTTRHLDAMLDALRFGSPERPRLVHRLDKDTSGVLVLARTVAAARELGLVFREGTARKTYWALVVGVPRPHRGLIERALVKGGPSGREAMAVEEDGRPAATAYAAIDIAASRAAWVALRPLTGRTHQLRVHMASIGTPILGDGKYGGRQAFLEGLGKNLHLHAWSIALPRAKGRYLRVVAPPPEDFVRDLDRLGFNLKEGVHALEGELGREFDELYGEK